MEVHFTPEQETQPSQIANHAGTDAERLVKDAALRLIQEEARFRAADKGQQFLYVSDGSNKKVQILNRETLQVVGFFGGYGGHGTGQFYHLHSIATDSKGNVYVGESF